jgi:hypothetical protein
MRRLFQSLEHTLSTGEAPRALFVIVVITGGRDFRDKNFVWQQMDHYASELDITAVVNGRAKTGVDQFVHEWCKDRGIPERPYPADWDTHGEAAGLIRNQEMIDSEPEIERCLVFDGGRGTTDMARRCRKAGIERVIINYYDPIEELVKWG